jgi:glycosyltransferase involved in cell wall biosynthesis
MRKVKVFTIVSALFKLLFRVAVKFKRVIIPLTPKNSRRLLKEKVLRLASQLKPTQDNKKIFLNEYESDGVNLIGYARMETGIGESCRIAARSLSSVGIPIGIINYEGTNRARMADYSWEHMEIKNPIYPINIFHINAEQMIEVHANYGNQMFDNKYNIGYWHWELPEFPDEWQGSFKFVNEVWVPSTFVANSISMNSPVPVVKIPHGVEVNITNHRDRAYFNLPKGVFLFLSMYDIKSYQERKNPLASIKAFKQAFGPIDKSVGLVIKVNNAKSDVEEVKSLRRFISDYSNIYLITEVLSRNDTNSLIQTTNSFISLHRSEGFGLGLAEAMYLGKPTIGTNWSANTDFMDNQNSCLVDYELIQVGKDYGPYKANQYWADPDIEHASTFMKRLVSDAEYYHQTSSAGELSIKRDYSPTVVGELIKKRLHYIRHNHGGKDDNY